MIARIFIFIILAIVLPDIYIYKRYIRNRKDLSAWLKAAWWMPGLVLVGYTIGLSLIRDFAPADIRWLNVYLFMFGIIAIPKLIFGTFSGIGYLINKRIAISRNYGNYIGVVAVLAWIYMLVYGSTAGVKQFEVRRIDISFADLPSRFDGYRIVHFSDAHVGSIDPDLMRRAVTAINGEQADAVMFTGDLQNMLPTELDKYSSILSSIHARDGVFSILGNHDYSMFVNDSPKAKADNEKELIRRERSYGWNLLLNSHKTIRRSADSIVIAGEENEGKPPFPDKSDIGKTLQGVGQGAFVIMLQHDPSAWRRTILKQSGAQLTLSGHTHGGQISLFGLRPTRLSTKEDRGLYVRDGRALYVSSGLGGFIPFRFNMKPEIVVITLHKDKQQTDTK